MNIQTIKDTLKYGKEYDFLKTNPRLGEHIAILTLGGSHAYGTNVKTSDIDIRGIAVNQGRDILLGKDFEQVQDNQTDTVIYSMNKMFHLLSNANPNVIELLGNRPESYFYISEEGQLLLDNAHLFLSKQCIYSFGGYATAQLRRLENKAARVVSQKEREQHILDTIQNAKYMFDEKYHIPGMELFLAQSEKDGYDSEIYLNANIKKIPARDFSALLGEINGIIRSYDKTGMRNSKAIEHNKLGKHMMHLLRLYLMCIDILEKEQIITYREAEHDLLMDIRDGKYLDANKQPKPEFFDILNEYQKRFDYAKENTALPDKPDMKEIEELHYTINKQIMEKELEIDMDYDFGR